MLNSCCCGCSLRNGTKAIANLSVVCWVLLLLRQGFHSRFLKIDEDSYAVSVAIIVSATVFIIMAVFLLAAVLDHKPDYILAWLVITAMKIMTVPICLIVLTVQACNSGNMFQVYMSLELGIPSIVLEVYFWLVVYSYFKEFGSTAIIKDNENITTPDKARLVITQLDIDEKNERQWFGLSGR